MQLEKLGWTRQFQESFVPYAEQGYVPGRVVLESRDMYRVIAEAGELVAEVSGRFRYTAAGRSDYPAVGDWVVLSPRVEEGRATVHAVLPRQSKFSRKEAGEETEEQVVAANIDTVLLLLALNNDFNMSRLERYLVQAWDSGASPVVVLTKADLCPPTKLQERISAVSEGAVGVPVHAISCFTGQGVSELNRYLLPGKTLALLGSSGVGKSTLINYFCGREIQKVQEVRKGDDRGRHTTTHRQLINLPQGAMVVDTPGMRELQLWSDDEGLSGTFSDIEELARACAFRDCQHKSEPGCAVKKAVSDGILDAKRLRNYHKLQRELEYLEYRQAGKTKVLEKKRWKKIAKMNNRRSRP